MNLPNEDDFPETPAELYDHLQREFGVGNYDELTGDSPWFKARMVEIGKLKRLMKSRRATERQVAIAAWYAKSTGVNVRVAHRLFPLIPEAMRAYNQAVAASKQQDIQDQVTTAVQEALAAGQTVWADRLMRTTTPEKVLSEWETVKPRGPSC